MVSYNGHIQASRAARVDRSHLDYLMHVIAICSRFESCLMCLKNPVGQTSNNASAILLSFFCHVSLWLKAFYMLQGWDRFKASNFTVTLSRALLKLAALVVAESPQ